jgi:hypothetical protein
LLVTQAAETSEGSEVATRYNLAAALCTGISDPTVTSYMARVSDLDHGEKDPSTVDG